MFPEQQIKKKKIFKNIKWLFKIVIVHKLLKSSTSLSTFNIDILNPIMLKPTIHVVMLTC